MWPEQEKLVEKQPQNGLQRIFDRFIQNGINHGRIEVEKNRNLSIYSRNLKKRYFEFGNEDLKFSEVFGAIGDQALFYRHKERLIVENIKQPKVEVTWILSAEGPFQYIRYYQDLSGGNNLILSYLTREEPAIGKRAMYVLSKNGSFMLDQVESDCSNPLISHNLNRPNLDTCFLGIGNESELIHGIYPVNAGDDELEIEESIYFPRSIDANLWLPRFLDQGDEIIGDPSMPWRKWFEQLGCKYEFFEKADYP